MNLVRRVLRPFTGLRLRDIHGVLIVFGCGLAVTALTAYKLAEIERERDRLDFEKHVSAARDATLDRIQTSVALLRGAAGLISAQAGTVDAAGFRKYVAQLSLRDLYPGVLGIGWSRRLPASELGATIAAAKRDVDPGFHLWPDHPREEYHVIVYLEPLDERNRVALGFDMSTEPIRAAAMERARDTGEPAATQRLTLVQEISPDKQPGFIIYLPVYRGSAVPETVAARRAQLLGHVYAPLRAGDFLSEVFASGHRSPIGIALYDGLKRDPRALLYRSRAETGASAQPLFSQVDTIRVAGTPWTLLFESGRQSPSAWATVAAALVAGTLLSLLLALVTWREAQAKAVAAQALARERAARGEAERASAIKDEFLATLSHELRTPLNAILGWAHVVSSGKASAEQVGTGLEAIERNAKVQVRLIDELLDMSRIVSGKLRLEMQTVDLAALVAASVESAAPSAAAKGLTLEQALRPGTRVRGDSSRLQQVVANLLGNAIKFTPQGGRVSVSVTPDGAEVALVVRDTGIGIEADFLPYVFERFRQADASRTRRHGGLGLGLSIVRHLVELHGGSVRAQSAGPGAGATFTVSLPCAGAAGEEAAQPAGKAEAQDHPRADLTGLRFLVVDDEEDARDLVRHVLEQQGAEVRVAASASDALAALDAWHPDLLLSDIGMPGMDGYALMRSVRTSLHRDTPAIAISAYARSEDRSRAMDAGYDAYLVKPLHPSSLLRAVSYFVARRRRAERDAAVEPGPP